METSFLGTLIKHLPNIAYKKILFSRILGECYLEVRDWWTPIIVIIFATFLSTVSQDHQQEMDTPFIHFKESNLKSRRFYNSCC
jgi:hypothetical protein